MELRLQNTLARHVLRVIVWPLRMCPTLFLCATSYARLLNCEWGCCFYEAKSFSSEQLLVWL